MRVSFWAGLALVAVLAGACGSGGPGATPTPAPTPTSPPIQATGTIAFITTEGELALASPNGSDLRTLTASGGVTGFQWSPDGSKIAVEASGTPATGVRVLLEDGSQVFEISGASDPVWSPSGAYLAVARDSGVAVVDAAGVELRRWTAAVRSEWSPDSASLAFVKLSDGGLGVPVIADVATGAVEPLAPDIASHKPDYPIAWHPSGGVIAYRDSLYEPATGSVTPLPGVPVSWNADGRMLMVTLAFVPADNATPAHLLDFTQGGKATIGLDVRPAPDGTPAWAFVRDWVAWSPDGRLLVYFDPEPQRLRVRIYDTVAVTQAIRKDIQGSHPDVSPDGTHVAFQHDGKVWVLALDGTALRDIVAGGSPAWQPAAP